MTELVALTRLPRLVLALKETYPNIVPKPLVDASRHLFTKLGDRELDLAIGLDPPARPDFNAVPLDSVQLQWMAAPGFGPTESTVQLAEVAAYPILTQAGGSDLQHLVLDWLTGNGLKLNRVVQCNSLNVLAGLASAGLGITFLTASYFEPEVAAGRLRVIKTIPRSRRSAISPSTGQRRSALWARSSPASRRNAAIFRSGACRDDPMAIRRPGSRSAPTGAHARDGPRVGR